MARPIPLSVGDGVSLVAKSGQPPPDNTTDGLATLVEANQRYRSQPWRGAAAAIEDYERFLEPPGGRVAGVGARSRPPGRSNLLRRRRCPRATEENSPALHRTAARRHPGSRPAVGS